MKTSTMLRALALAVACAGASGSAFAGIIVAPKIPALDEFGLAGLAAALAVAGIVAIRNNRKK